MHRGLRQLARELLSRKPGGHLVEADLDALELRLDVDLRDDADEAAFAGRLVEAIDRHLDDAIQHAIAFRPGRAWCHRCGGSDCEDGIAPSSRHVFVGYAQTGAPQWMDFAQLCLEARHPGVDTLYGARPALLTLLHGEEELRGALIPAFERSTFALLGQVTAGFWTVESVPAEAGRAVLALTIQLAATRARDGRRRYGINVLGRTPDGEPLHLLWERQADLPWRKAVGWAQRALDTLRGGPDRPETARRVQGILSGLARRLERDSRARSWRTRHAETRHRSGRRPTRKAIDDARTAREGAILADPRNGTVVVLGERGRTHFFTPEGQHVSSVRYSRDAIERKRREERWEPADPSLRDEFLGNLPG